MKRFFKTRFIFIICLTLGLGFAFSSVVQAQEEGCGPGFWKQEQHLDFWVVEDGVTPDDSFNSVFGVEIDVTFKEKGTKGKPQLLNDPTLIQALQAKGGKVNALARQAVAALLNAQSPDVEYPMEVGMIISLVNEALTTGENIEELKDMLELANEMGCPLNEDEI